MNYKKLLSIFLLIFLTKCTTNIKDDSKQFLIENNFVNRGFALVYSENLYKKNIINKKIDNRSYLIFQKNLKKNSSVKITNLLNGKSIIAKVKSSKTDYPFFYNSVISQRISEDLEINHNEPYIEITLISNKSTFIAKKTKTWEEEKEVAQKAPVDGIVINDLNSSLIKKDKKQIIGFLYSIKIADFYYEKSALQMLDRIKKETSIENSKIIPISKTKFRVILGPFNDMISLKKSYEKTLVLNFENLEIIRHD